jgi:alanine racemase
MNLTMVDITDITGVRYEEPVTLIGRQRKESVSVEQLAGWSGSINYEILARLSSNTPRLVVVN